MKSTLAMTTVVLTICNKIISRMLQECDMMLPDPALSPPSYMYGHPDTGVTRVFHMCYKDVTRVLQMCYKGVT
jgi:hypothetical protein